MRGALGIWEGKISYDDDLFEPDEELIDLFYNGDIFPDDAVKPDNAAE
jgi:hypothetical protein